MKNNKVENKKEAVNLINELTHQKESLIIENKLLTSRYIKTKNINEKLILSDNYNFNWMKIKSLSKRITLLKGAFEL